MPIKLLSTLNSTLTLSLSLSLSLLDSLFAVKENLCDQGTLQLQQICYNLFYESAWSYRACKVWCDHISIVTAFYSGRKAPSHKMLTVFPPFFLGSTSYMVHDYVPATYNRLYTVPCLALHIDGQWTGTSSDMRFGMLIWLINAHA